LLDILAVFTQVGVAKSFAYVGHANEQFPKQLASVIFWQLGIAVTHLIKSTKLLYDRPGWYCDG